jgi:hypothetical protein
MCAKFQEYNSLTTREVFHLVDDNIRGKRVCVLTRAYIDDSQDGKLEHFVHMTAALGSVKQWTGLNHSWKSCLKTAPKIRYFKSREWHGLDGEFSQFKDGRTLDEARIEADKKRDSLKEIITRSGLGIIGCVIPIDAYQSFRALDPAAANLFCADPLEQALNGILMALCKLILAQKDRHHISFVYDEDTNRKEIFRKQYDSFKVKNPTYAEVMRSFAQLDDAKWPGLQMADLLANIATRELRKILPVWDGQTPTYSKWPELEKDFKGITVYTEKFMAEVLIGNGGPDLRNKIRTGSEQFQKVVRPRKPPQFRRPRS